MSSPSTNEIPVSAGRAALLGKPTKAQLAAAARMKATNSIADYLEFCCNIDEAAIDLMFLNVAICFPAHIQKMEVVLGQAISMDSSKTFEQRMAGQVHFVNLVVPGPEPTFLLQGSKHTEMEDAASAFIKAVNYEVEKHVADGQEKKAGGAKVNDESGDKGNEDEAKVPARNEKETDADAKTIKTMSKSVSGNDASDHALTGHDDELGYSPEDLIDYIAGSGTTLTD